jgi:hypothetical protein
LIPFHVDPSWYERYWWHDSAPRKPGIFAFFRRILSQQRTTRRQDVRADHRIPALTFNEDRPTWRRAVWTNSVEVPRDRRYFFIAATVGVAAAALLDVRASRQAQDRPLSADRRVEAILTTSARG